VEGVEDERDLKSVDGAKASIELGRGPGELVHVGARGGVSVRLGQADRIAQRRPSTKAVCGQSQIPAFQSLSSM
jgi:hypothetical protein